MRKDNEKLPKQIFWDVETKVKFEELVKKYDATLTLNKAILKLINQAITEDYLPGYIKKEKVEITHKAGGLLIRPK